MKLRQIEDTCCCSTSMRGEDGRKDLESRCVLVFNICTTTSCRNLQVFAFATEPP